MCSRGITNTTEQRELEELNQEIQVSKISNVFLKGALYEGLFILKMTH